MFLRMFIVPGILGILLRVILLYSFPVEGLGGKPKQQTIYILQSTYYNLHTTIYILQSTYYNLLSTIYNLHTTIYFLQFTIYRSNLLSQTADNLHNILQSTFYNLLSTIYYLHLQSTIFFLSSTLLYNIFNVLSPIYQLSAYFNLPSTF